MRISDWSSDVCSSDLLAAIAVERGEIANRHVDGAADADDRHAGVAARGNGRLVDRAGDAADPELLPGDDARRHRQVAADEIGRATCGESVWQYVSFSVVAVSLKKKKTKKKNNT